MLSLLTLTLYFISILSMVASDAMFSITHNFFITANSDPLIL
jgi:hypothetical protein